MELVVVSSDIDSVVVVSAASVVVTELEPFAGGPGNPVPRF